MQDDRPTIDEEQAHRALNLDWLCGWWTTRFGVRDHVPEDPRVDPRGRPAGGTIIERVSGVGRVTRTLRFFADGSKRTVALGAVTREEAEQRLAWELARVHRGRWQPSEQAIAAPTDVPSFRRFAEEWWALHEHQLSEGTRRDYRRRLDRHLVDYFGPMALDGITVDTVERYIRHKLAENERIRAAEAHGEPIMEAGASGSRTRLRRARPLSARSINMTILLLGQIMEVALERDLILRNPIHHSRCRLVEHRPPCTYTESSEGIAALLEAAGDRAVIALLCFAGLRVAELCALRWRCVDIAAGWLTIEDATSDTRVRRVRMRGVVRDELAAIRPADVNPEAHVFVTSRGRKLNPTSIGTRYVRPAVEAANLTLTERGLATLPRLTPRSLRKTYASVLCALGESPATVMREMGHASPQTVLAIYAHAMRRSEADILALRALVEGAELRHPIQARDTRLSTEWPTSVRRTPVDVPSSPPGAR